MNQDAYVPMPDTCHPHYAGQADSIKSALMSNMRQIRVVEARRLTAGFFAGEEDKPVLDAALPIRTLDIKKCYGPAPFVGDPLLQKGGYFWEVAMDDLGRHVAGPAELEIIWSMG